MLVVSLETSNDSPHCVEKGAIVHQSQEFVGSGHVVSHRFLPIVEESVWSPDFTG